MGGLEGDDGIIYRLIKDASTQGEYSSAIALHTSLLTSPLLARHMVKTAPAQVQSSPSRPQAMSQVPRGQAARQAGLFRQGKQAS